MNSKHALLTLLIGTLLTSSTVSCNRGTGKKLPQAIEPTETVNTVTDSLEKQTATVYELIPNSLMVWKGATVIGGSHEGTLHLTSGWVGASSDGKITGGDFTIDMNSIKNTDRSDVAAGGGLEAHLKNDDFFSTTTFPTAHFTITSAVPLDDPDRYAVTGKLLLKGIQNGIRFPATIIARNDTLHAWATFSWDRTQWGIDYDSETSFSNRIKNQGIANKVGISLDLLFRRKE